MKVFIVNQKPRPIDNSSLSLIFLAKHLQAIFNDSFETVRRGFLQLFPHYMSGKGIETYITNNR